MQSCGLIARHHTLHSLCNRAQNLCFCIFGFHFYVVYFQWFSFRLKDCNIVYIKIQTVVNEWPKIMTKIFETVENRRWFHSIQKGKFNCIKWSEYSIHCTMYRIYTKCPERRVLLFHTLNCSKKHIILDTRSHRIGVHIKYAAIVAVLWVHTAHTVKGRGEGIWK